MPISDQLSIITGTLHNNVLKHSSTGTAYCQFSIGEARRKKNQNTGKFEFEKMVFYRCIAFGKEAEHIGKFPAKETKIQAALQFDQNEYQDKDGNNKRSDQFILRKLLEIMPKPNYNEGGNQGGYQQQNTAYQNQPNNSGANSRAPQDNYGSPPAAKDFADDDIPF